MNKSIISKKYFINGSYLKYKNLLDFYIYRNRLLFKYCRKDRK